MMRLVNILALSINQERKRFLSVRKNNNDNNMMSSNINTRNHASYTPPRKPFIPVTNSTPQLWSLGILFCFFKRGGGGGDYSHQQHREFFPGQFDFAENYATKEQTSYLDILT